MNKPPHPLILEAIDRDYTYDPDTGTIRNKEGDPVGVSKRKPIILVISAPQAEYLSLACNCQFHHVAWYLSYGMWPDKEIDHIDGNNTNNRLKNLRLATDQENSFNKGKNKSLEKATSQYKGVHLSKGKWRASIMVNYKHQHQGYFPTEVEAARAYDVAARRLHGEFARLNFPDVGDQADLALPEENGV